MPEAGLQSGLDQGQMLAFLIRLINAKRTLEIGVFTGYSTLVTALALPVDGKVIACDVSEEYTNIAKEYWAKAQVDHKIDLRIAPALETLTKLLEAGVEFDFCFIDADKPNYWSYFDSAVRLTRPGGLIVVDNVLWHGAIADDSVTDDATNIMREFNAKVSTDPRVEICMAPVGDGFTLARVL